MSTTTSGIKLARLSFVLDSHIHSPQMISIHIDLKPCFEVLMPTPEWPNPQACKCSFSNCRRSCKALSYSFKSKPSTLRPTLACNTICITHKRQPLASNPSMEPTQHPPTLVLMFWASERSIEIVRNKIPICYLGLWYYLIGGCEIQLANKLI